MKKIWFLFLSLFIIFWFWVSFANPIAPETYYVCSMFENIEIDNYRVIVQNGSSFYEPTVKTCSQCWEHQINNHDIDRWNIIKERSYEGPTQEVFLLDKTINLEGITTDNVDVKAIPIWSIISTFCDISYNKTRMYKVVNSWGNYTMLNRTQHYRDIQEMKNKIKKIPFFRLLTIIIETLVLFFITKIVRKDEPISNKKLLLFWIIPTTVTLPLLWFVLPLVIWNWILYIVVWEMLVIILEAIMLKYWLNISWKKSIILSIICNVFSFLILWWGSLIMDFYDNQRIIFSFSIPIWVKIYLPVLYFLTEFVVLCIMGKIWWNNSEISKKKLILTWIVAPFISILVLILLVWGIIALDAGIWLENRWALIAILVSLFIEILLIKKLLKISWKKSIIMVFLSILCFIIISFFVRSILFGL